MLCASAFQFTKTGMRLRMKDKRECTRTFWSETYQKVQNHRFCFKNTSFDLKLARKGKARVMSVGCSAHDESESGGGGVGDDSIRALETVLKLYAAIKNRSRNQISDVIGDECLCICNFASSFQLFCGKEQVLAFFTSLMNHLGNNIEFIVQPTFQDGLNVGISWKLEWRKNHVPLGKGFSFYTCHIYHGKMVIRNFEMFLEPILHIEPFRLKTVALLMNVVDEVWWLQSLSMFKEKAKEFVKNPKIMYPLLLMVVIFFIVKHLY